MEAILDNKSIRQIPMQGMPMAINPESYASHASVLPGQKVMYSGWMNGGPPYGASGIIKETLRKRAVVYIKDSGIWNIPYYFLTKGLKNTRSKSRIAYSQPEKVA
jgi:hypothetical protein